MEEKIELGKKAGGDFKKEIRCVTTKRNFGLLPKYAGNHYDYDDWKFKVSIFLSGEVEFRILVNLMEQ